MASYLTYAALLFIPVLFILFVNIRQRQKLTYTHLFFYEIKEKSFMDYLLRVFQLYYDVVFDVLMIFLLAALLSGFFENNKTANAVCLDGSFSMILSDGKAAAFNKIVDAYYEDFHKEKKQDLYLLTWSQKKRKSVLVKINKYKKLEKEDFIKQITSKYPFFNVNYHLLGDLSKKYQQVTFLTDQLDINNTENIKVREVGEPKVGYAYPIGSQFNFYKGQFELFLYHNLTQPGIQLHKLSEKRMQFYTVQPQNYQIEKDNRFLKFYIDDPGIYQVSVKQFVYFIELVKPEWEIETAGDISKIIAQALPMVAGKEKSDKFNGTKKNIPLLQDIKADELSSYKATKQSTLLAILEKNNQTKYLLDLNDTFAELIPATLLDEGQAKKIRNKNYHTIVLAPQSIINPSLPLFFINLLQKIYQPYQHQKVNYGKILFKVSTSQIYQYSYDKQMNYNIVTIDGREVFGNASWKFLSSTNERKSSWYIFLLLAVLYVAKLIIFQYLNRVKK
ncbi:MAG: hypothetical protein MJB14_18315 [Spirochaetes bacterium]|nr:hypothetical protein [Spirochaetota bacterium]